MSASARTICVLACILWMSTGTAVGATEDELWRNLVNAWREHDTRDASVFEWESAEEDDEFSRLLAEDSPEEEANVRSERFAADEPVKGSSLVFVFDSTGSMKPELAQVKIGASKILEALRVHPDVPIHNYIMVPFKDPDVGPVTVTTDHSVFKESMENITAFGGGDCPEASIAAIRKALQISLPRSYIYVFTDAAAKDYRYQNEVLSLIQRKKSQVDFVMTDDCGSTLEEGYKVYERIAETSSGQLYRLNKDEVEQPSSTTLAWCFLPNVVLIQSPANLHTPLNIPLTEYIKKMVLKYVKVALQPNVVNLLSQHKPAPDKDSPDEHEVLVDKTLQEFTISVSGKNTSINLTDPKGENVDGPPKLKSLLHLDNVKIVSVKEPDPGFWKVLINSDSDYRLRSTGLSGVNFKHGFSTVDTDNIKETNYRPLKGALCYLLIETDASKVHNITSVDLINLNGDTIQRLDLEPVPGNEGLYKASAFLPPTDFFYIGILGCGKDGLPIKRVTTTAINPQSPEKPIISMVPTMPVVFHSPVAVACYVESLVPFTVEWYRENSFTGIQQNCSQTCEVTFPIARASHHSEGNYTCVARNVAGTAKGTTMVTIREPLALVVEPKMAMYLTGDQLRIYCSAPGKPQTRLEWRRYNRKINDEDPRIAIRETGHFAILEIGSSRKEDAGVYTCHAYTPQESVQASTELVYTEKPSINAERKTIMAKNEEEIILRCSATGIPEPRISWYKDGDAILDESRIEVRETGELRIKRTRASDSGEFSCEASNSVGTDADRMDLFVGTSPMFLQIPKDRRIELGQKATVPCSAIGIPSPEIRWERENKMELDPTRATVSSNGTLVILDMDFEDVGGYVCTAENAFGAVTTDVKIDIHGIEKPVVDDGVVLSEVKGIGGSDLRIPCGMNLGNPPGRVQWLKDGHPVAENPRIKIYGNGDLEILNSTASDRGSYKCFVSNWAGNSSRSYDLVVSEIPKIAQNFSSNLKGRKGGEIIIPCPAEGYPLPSITWTKNGQPLPISSTIFQSENGSLIIRNLEEENSGLYVCTGQNSVGTARRAVSVQVQVPPVFTEEALDESLKIVEGYVVLLNCNSKAHPKATVEWFKDGRPLLRGEDTVGDQRESLRFVARVEDDGLYKCVAKNEAGSNFKEFNVTVLVPPSILDSRARGSIKAKAGKPLTLECKVRGVPAPTILWQRNGMYLTQNTSEMTVSDSGLLVLENVTTESAGPYVCDAENLAGIVQRIYYVQVHYAPRIRDESLNESISLKEGEEYSLPCSVVGNPKPLVIWRKNGFLLKDDEAENLIILGDNTLVLLQAKQETRGTYKCEATNEEGSAFREYKIEVVSPPSLSPADHHTRKKVNEGETIMLTCPISESMPRPTIQWLKDGKPVNVLLQERSDEAIIKLSEDQRELTIVEAHPSDGGNYSCTATNAAGRADAKFVVDVLMTPHFEEFNHLAHRTIITGGEVDLNCSVSGNPQPKVTWRKEDVPIMPENHPGIHISLDQQHLIIQNGKIHHSGTYICTAVNEVNRKEREFYVSVLEPPFITGSLQEDKDVVAGENLSLHCPFTGVPQPKIIWYKLGQNKTVMNGSGEVLEIGNANCENEGTYMCEVTNTAGTKTKKFTVTVLEPPGIESHNVVDKLITQVGGNVSMKCKAKGHPKPEITWLHKGRIIHKIRTKRDTTDELEFLGDMDLSEDGFISLSISNITQDYEGVYTVLASNKVGVVEKNFEVSVLSSPAIPYSQNHTETIMIVRAFPIVLKCPALGNPLPVIRWFLNDVQLFEDDDVYFFDDELLIINANTNHSGRFRCLAENAVGNATLDFIVKVLEPPVIEKTDSVLNVKLNETLTLYCKDTVNADTTYSWLHKSEQLNNSSRTSILANGTSLVISNVEYSDSGEYTCIASNTAGFTKIHYKVYVIEAPMLNGIHSSEYYKNVELRHPILLECSFTGRPEPKITWFKNGKEMNSDEKEDRIQRSGSFLIISNVVAEDRGEYKCLAENPAGVEELSFILDVYAIWSQWSAWSSCSVSCGIGEQMRTRSCDAVLSDSDKGLFVDRSKCEGENTEKRKCLSVCQVDGGWGYWSGWSPYSATCGKAVRRKYRSCNNPEPINNGKNCEGPDIMVENIDLGECPVHPEWSEWSAWSICTRSCGFGTKTRHRKCEPSQNGVCPGSSVELRSCNEQNCPDGWLEWSAWSPCSSTCGRGQRKRVRKCGLKGDCKGENLQIEKCVTEKCSGSVFPSSANFKVIGKLNGRDVEERFDVNIVNHKNERIISANMNDLLRDEDKWFPYAQFLMSPLSWSTAYENDNADNGYSLTNGNYFSQSDIKFATGEGLVVKHHGNGVNNDGALEVQIEVVGEVPLLEPHASVIIKNVDQDYVQTGSNMLYSNVQNDINTEDGTFPFVWNSSISYNNAQGTMPYLVEKLSVKDIQNYYDPGTKNVSYLSSSTIGKRYEENECPRGFIHKPEWMHCQDIDECENGRTECGENEFCENTFGSFECVCKEGYIRDRGSSVCSDIDECVAEQNLCSHFCHNSLGSYSCSCPYGFYLTQDLRTCNELILDENSFYRRRIRVGNNQSHPQKFLEYFTAREESDENDTENGHRICPPGFFFQNGECKDRDECVEENDLCDHDELCLNTLGSYQCLNIPCPHGFGRDLSSKNCIKQCRVDRTCRSNTLLSEVVSFNSVVKSSASPFVEILKLNVIAEAGVNIVSTKFRVIESDKLFRVRELRGKGSLYALRILNKDTVYRVKIEARAFDAKNVFLYYVEFVVYIIVI